jgi:hypothetical protein
MVRLLPLAVVLGCAAAPQEPATLSEEELRRIKRLAFEPDTAFESFSQLVALGQTSPAWQLLARPARLRLSEEEFKFAMANFKEMSRMLASARVHALRVDGDGGVARVCNPEFRWSEPFALVREPIGARAIWTFDLTPEQVRRMTDAVLGGYRARTDDGARHVFPSIYPHPGARRPCPCGGRV